MWERMSILPGMVIITNLAVDQKYMTPAICTEHENVIFLFVTDIAYSQTCYLQDIKRYHNEKHEKSDQVIRRKEPNNSCKSFD